MKRIYFCLIIILSDTGALCRNQHWYEHFYKDKITSSNVQTTSAADERTSSSVTPSLTSGTTESDGIKGSLQNSDIFHDDYNRAVKLGVGAGIGIIIAAIVGVAFFCFCCFRCCYAVCNNDQQGHVIVMNQPQRDPVPPQMIVQHVPVPYQPRAYPSQHNLPYAPQVTPQMQHMSQQGTADQWQKFETHQEMLQANYSPHDGYSNPNNYPATAPPPYGQ